MPPEDTSYYEDLNPDGIGDIFDLPHTFTVEKRDGQLVLYSGEKLAYIVIDEDSDVSPGDEVTVSEKDGKILTSVRKEITEFRGVSKVRGARSYSDEEIEQVLDGINLTSQGGPVMESTPNEEENVYAENFDPAEQIEEWLSEPDGPPVTKSLLDAALHLYENGGTEHHIQRVYENPESFTEFENCLGSLFEDTADNYEWARATEEFAEQVSLEDDVWVQYDDIFPIMHNVPDANEEPVEEQPGTPDEYAEQYGKREIEPGVYKITGTKGPGDKVSSPREISETIDAPLPDKSHEDTDQQEPRRP